MNVKQLLALVFTLLLAGSAAVPAASASESGQPSSLPKAPRQLQAPVAEVLEGVVEAGLLVKDHFEGKVNKSAHARAQTVNAGSVTGAISGTAFGTYAGGAQEPPLCRCGRLFGLSLVGFGNPSMRTGFRMPVSARRAQRSSRKRAKATSGSTRQARAQRTNSPTSMRRLAISQL